MSGAEIESVCSKFDILAHRSIQTCVLGTVETGYKPIGTWIRTIRNF